MKFLLPFALLLLATEALAQDTHLILLGTGTPNPDPERMGPSLAIVSDGRVYLVDAGPGIVRRAVQAGLKMEELGRAFLTHLHSDHTVGLPDLIYTPAVTGREDGIDLYGPPGLQAMVGHIRQAWSEDVDIRLHGGEPSVAKAYDIRVHDVAPGEVYRDKVMRVVAFPVDHGAWKQAYGYRFEAKDRVIVVSGDTRYSKSLIEAAKGCDILVHEVYSAQGVARRSAAWQAYDKAFHTSGFELGRLAAEIKPRILVLDHQLLAGSTYDEILAEVRSQFTGTIVSAKDLDVVR